MSLGELRREQQWELYLIHFPPWHPAHALKSEYPMVLHLHKLELSTTLGPEYSDPGGSGLTVNAAKNMRCLNAH
jgi:hypothetical protein